VARELTCPSCGHVLRVPEDMQEPWVTCPRCLASVNNPLEQSITAAPPPATPTAAISAETQHPSMCPGCSKNIDPQWRFCPHCNYPLQSRDERFDVRVPERDIRRDSKRTGAGLILLAVLGALGIGGNLLAALGAAAEGRSLTPLFAVGLAIAFLAAVATGIMFLRTRHDPSARGVRRVIFGTLALMGGLMAAAIVVALAVIIFVLVACWGGFR
jgi:Double zinc ribbon